MEARGRASHEASDSSLSAEGRRMTEPRIRRALQGALFSGSLGEWLFFVESGRGARIVNLRKFAVLVWSRIEATR